MTKKDFTHLDKETGNPAMVDVGEKEITQRYARASCRVILGEEIMGSLNEASELMTRKGPVFQTAIIAGTMGAKRTADLIPLCHPIGMDDCKLTIEITGPEEITISCSTRVKSRTGVEMEAMTGVTVAALTIYDMCKGFSHDIVINEIRIEEKTGGKRDFKR
jgi:cyclic pyranopterin phosphate synthase